MAKYRVTETLPCWVIWSRLVVADSAEQALLRFNEGEGDGPIGQTIGDILDGYNQNQTAELED